MRGFEYAELRAFAAVAAHGSFTRAASELRLSPSALSQVIRRLEARLGVTLLNRTTRSVRPSEAGTRLLARVTSAFSELDGAVEEASQAGERPRGHVRLNAPRIALATFVAPVLRPFAALYPEVIVEVVVDDALTDIIAAGCDLGIRLGERLERDMVADRLGGAMEMMAVASPEYLDAHGVPQHPSDLQNHSCINYRLPREGGLYRWEFERGGQALTVAVEGPLITADHDLIRQAALDGIGVAYLMDAQASSTVEQGLLVRVLADWSPSFPGFHLYRPTNRQASPAASAFARVLTEQRMAA